MFWSFHPEFHEILTKMPSQDELEAFVKCWEFAAAVWGLTKTVLLLPVQTQLEYDCLKCKILQCLDQIHKQNRQYFRSETHSKVCHYTINVCLLVEESSTWWWWNTFSIGSQKMQMRWTTATYWHCLKKKLPCGMFIGRWTFFTLSFSLLPRKKGQIKPQNPQPNPCIPSLPILFLLLLSLCTKYRKWPPKWGTPKSMRSRV